MLSPAEIEAILLSLRIAALSVAVSLPFAIAVAWALARLRFPGKTLIDGIVHLPLVLPPVVIGYLLLITLGVQGPIGGWLDRWFGIRLVFTAEGAALAAAAMSFPLFVRAVRLSLEAADRGLEAAARSLGATRGDVLFSVTLPLALPGILAGAVTAFAASLGEFGATITFAANVEGETRTLTLAIYTALQTPGGEGTAARLVAVSFVLSLAALLASEAIARSLRRSIDAP